MEYRLARLTTHYHPFDVLGLANLALFACDTKAMGRVGNWLVKCTCGLSTRCWPGRYHSLSGCQANAASSGDESEFDYRRGVEVIDSSEAEPLIGQSAWTTL